MGQTVEVLFEEQKEIDGKLYMTGHTKEYVQVALETTEDLSNRMVKGAVSGFLTDDILLLNFSDI